MNKTKLKKLKEYLLDQRSKIVTQLNKHEDIDIHGDEVDKIQGEALTSMLERLSFRDKNKLLQIDTALIAIEDGSIDECESCGESIGEKRLLAIPGVRICISCAEEAENNSKMFA